MKYSLAVLLLVCIAAVQATCPWDTPGATRWSSWSSAPAAGNTVNITSGMTVIYDLTTAVRFAGIWVNAGGVLIFDNVDNIVMETGFIVIEAGASFYIGSTACPFNKKATVTYFGTNNGYSAMEDFGYKGLISRGNVQIISGATRYPTWTRLSSTLQVSGTSITVADNVKWIAGDVIVIASTDYNAALSERFTVVSVSGNTITLDRPATYMHWGSDYEKAEVGLLTRNILFQGDISSDQSTFGGQTFIRAGFVQIQGAEFARMGQAGILGRYPVHYHFLGEQTGNNVFLRDASIHDTYQRCFTIHASNGILADGNVAFNATGHCYFLEDGIEVGNTFNNNLGIYTKPGLLLPSDSEPTIYWIVNPNNTYTNNVAVGGTFGFWFSMPIHPTGKSTAAGVNVWPRFTPLLLFDNNVAHSVERNGVHIDDGTNTDETTSMSSYTPLQAPYTTSTQVYNTPQITATFTRQLSYKCRNYGWWARGASLTIANSVFVDNQAGVNQPADSNLVRDCIFIGQTDNYGTLKQVSWAQEDGRARPIIWNKAAIIHGFESYDSTGPQFSLRNTFINYTNDATRRAGAFGALPSGKFVLPWTNMLRQSTLKDGCNEWAMEPNTNQADGPQYSVTHDVDGSVTGAYGSFITANASIVRDSTCVQKASWGDVWPFFVCPKTENGYSFLTINNPNTGATNFGTSLNDHYRANFYKLGTNTPNPVTGGDTDSNIRDSYTANVPSRNAYTIRFTHPTPPSLQVGIMHGFTGEWVVVALPYPQTTFTITRGYANTPLTPVNSRAAVSATTYYYDSTGQHLYVMYYEDDGSTVNPQGFPENGYIGSQITIQAGCGTSCSVSSANLAIPAAWVDTDDKYKAVANGCGANNNGSPYEATAYFQYNAKTHVMSYLIYHNHPSASAVQIVNSKGQVIHTTPVPQSPVKSAFVLSASWFADLYAGKWSVIVATATYPLGELSGTIGCSSGSCSPPPGLSTSDPCAVVSGESIVYDDALGSIGWADWSYSITRDLASTAVTPKCGSKSAYVTYQGGALSLNQGGCYPGQCDSTKPWIKPYLAIGSLQYLQFVVRTLNGTADISVAINTPDGNSASIGPVPFNYIDNYSVQDFWTRVKIPVSALGLNSSSYVGRITLSVNQPWQPANQGIVLVFDQIKFVPAYSDPTAAPTTTPAAAYSAPNCGSTSVTLPPSTPAPSTSGAPAPTTAPAPSSTPAATAAARAPGIYTLVKQSATWKYSQVDPGNLNFTTSVPSDWALGYAPFGFGGTTAYGTVFNNTGGAYFFSRTFRVTGDPTTVTGARLRVSANRDVQFYINGRALNLYPSGTKTAAYWNAMLNVDTTNWISGNNMIAVVMEPKSTSQAFFDAKLTIGETDASALTSEDLANSASTLMGSIMVTVAAVVLLLVL